MEFFYAFRVEKFEIHFDTGDDVLNARLYPVCHVLTKGNRQVIVNYDDYQLVLLEIRTRMIYFVNGGLKFAWLAFVKPGVKRIF